VIRATTFCLSSVGWVCTNVFDIIVNLSDLLVNLLILLRAVDIVTNSIVLLMRSRLSYSILLLRLSLWSTSLPLVTSTDVTRISIQNNVWNSSWLFERLLTKAIGIWVMLPMSFLWYFLILNLIPEFHQCLVNTPCIDVYWQFVELAIDVVETSQLSHLCQGLDLKVFLTTLSEQFLLL
jgi:hypothetical protein